MSKNPKRLWQRLKLFFTAETSAPLPIADKTNDPSQCAETGEHTDATGYQPFAKNLIFSIVSESENVKRASCFSQSTFFHICDHV